MEKHVVVTVESTQLVDGEHEEMELTTTGMYLYGPDACEIKYEEPEFTGLEGSHTTVSTRADGAVSIRRTGKADSLLLVKQGRTNLCTYNTGYGEALLGITGTRAENRLSENGGSLYFAYSLSLGGTLLSENTIRITVKESGISGSCCS